MKRKLILKSSFLMFFVFTVLLTSFFLNKGSDYVATSSGSINEPLTVIIDAGHGGFDGGAVAHDGTSEKDINLNIASTVGKMLEFNGINVIMTRTDDTGTEDDRSSTISRRKVSDMKNRLSIINNTPNSVFVSIHLNKYTASSANGAQVFYSKNNSDSSNLGDCIQKSVVKQLQNDNKRVIKQATKSTYLLYNAKVPAVIVECGFLSNAEELRKLKTDEYQKQMAFSIYNGILDYLS